MPAYSKTLKADIAKRIEEGKLKISSNFAKRDSPLKKMYAQGRLRAREMNKTEKEYSEYLQGKIIEGRLLWREFEGVKLRLADNTFYTPDFFVMTAEGELQVYEVKGYMMDDANVKIKCAAEKYPFRFFVVRKAKNKTWDIKEVGNK